MMEIVNNYFLPAALALSACLAGVLLFRLGGKEIGKGTEPESGEKEVRPHPCWMAGMCICSMSMSVYMEAVCGPDIFARWRILLLCTILWVLAWTDLKSYLIPNKILLAALAVWTLLFAAEALMRPEAAAAAAAASGVPAAAMLAAGLLCRLIIPNSVGFGDIKLFAVMGLFLGMEYAWGVIFYSMLSAFAGAVFLLVTKRATRKSVMPFAPFLLSGTIFAVFINRV